MEPRFEKNIKIKKVPVNSTNLLHPKKKTEERKQVSEAKITLAESEMQLDPCDYLLYQRGNPVCVCH